MSTASRETRPLGTSGVYEAIRSVQLALAGNGITKSRKNEAQGYQFRGIDDVYNALAVPLADAGLCIIPRIKNRSVTERTNQKGTVLFYVAVEAEYDLVGPDGSMHTASSFGEAMDSGDKATNKAMSAAYKYMCMQLFCIPTEADNDADATTHEIKARIEKAKEANEARKAPHFVEPELRGEGAILPDEPPSNGEVRWPGVFSFPPSNGAVMPDARKSQRDAEAKAALATGPKQSRKKGDISFKALGEIGKLKDSLREITGTNDLYYETLQAFGVSHADELSQDEGKKLWKTLKEITTRLSVQKTEQRIETERRDELTKQMERVGIEKFMRVLGANSFESLTDLLTRSTVEQEHEILTYLKQLA